MFIAQLLYAEGLVKVLNAILCVRRYEAGIMLVNREIRQLTLATDALGYGQKDSSLLAAHRELAKKQARKNELVKQRAVSVTLLESCGIKDSEHEEKFRLIAADCLRISHSCVKPPLWQQAA